MPPRRPRPPAPPAPAHPARRLALCSIVVVLVFGLLAARVAQLQIFSGDKYQHLALAQTLHTVPLSAERGTIFDRNGRDLAMSIGRTTVYADPTLVTDPVAEAAKLAPVLKVDQQLLLRRLADKGTTEHPRRFAYLARTVSDDVATAVKALSLPGIGFVPESARSYPAGAVAGSIIGHVGTDGTGLDGLEYLYGSQLAGKPGELVVEQDPLGHDIPNTQRTRVDARRGTDLVLSVDEDMQWQTEHSLLDQVQATHAKGGMAVVVDVTNGDVMSMATIVGATATDPARVARPGEHNAPLSDLYEPGSTNKLITMSWAIEHGLVTPQTKFTVPYKYQVDPHVAPYEDAEWHATEQWTTADILRESSNVGTIQIAQKMRNQELYDALRAFGFGTRTSIEWPGQQAGLLLPPSQYYASGKYSTAIGYGAAVTGVQVLDALTTIANGGVTRPPHLLDATIDANGARHAVPVPAGHRVVSTNTANEMTTMLEGVVAGGTGACAAVPGYVVAGKTGTSKKSIGGSYSATATMASFEGFVPAEHPRFAAIVVLDQPTLQYGGTAAAPVFSELMQFALTQYDVPPTDTANAQYNAAQATAKAAGNSCTVPHGAALQRAMSTPVAPTATTVPATATAAATTGTGGSSTKQTATGRMSGSVTAGTGSLRGRATTQSAANSPPTKHN